MADYVAALATSSAKNLQQWGERDVTAGGLDWIGKLQLGRSDGSASRAPQSNVALACSAAPRFVVRGRVEATPQRGGNGKTVSEH